MRAVPIQLHAVVVGVTQVQRLADPVVAGTVQNDPASRTRRKATASAFLVG